MKLTVLRWVRIVCVGLVFLSPALAPAAERWSEEQIREILSDRIDVAKQSVGIVVGFIDDDGRIVVGHGKVAFDDDTTPDGETLFEIGSATKVFTGILLADMARAGKVKLDDPVQKYLPDSAKMPVRDDRPITLYDLATHTSGLPRLPANLAPADPGNPYADYSVENLYEFLANHELARGPGVEPEYSNLGMGLLGHVLALQANTDYDSLVRRRIAVPLGMRETMIALSPKLEARLAQGHDGNLQPTANWDIPTLAGDGALRSTVYDLLKFVAANLDPAESKLPASLQEAQKPREDFGPGGTQVGLAWFISSREGTTIIWHNGQTGGYHSFVGFDRERRRGVVVLSNASPSIDDIGFHLLEPKIELAKFTPSAPSAEVPDSPVGNALTLWLEATRSADDDVARSHYEANFADEFKAAVPVDTYMTGRGGLRTLLLAATLGKVIVRSDHDLSAYISSGGTWFAIQLQVTADESHKITGLLIQPSKPPETSK